MCRAGPKLGTIERVGASNGEARRFEPHVAAFVKAFRKISAGLTIVLLAKVDVGHGLQGIPATVAKGSSNGLQFLAALDVRENLLDIRTVRIEACLTGDRVCGYKRLAANLKRTKLLAPGLEAR